MRGETGLRSVFSRSWLGEPISAAGLSAWCQLFQPARWESSLMAYYFLLLVPLSEHLFTESALTWLLYPFLFPPFFPSGEFLQSEVVHSACHFHEQGRSSFCPCTSYSDSLKHTCACAYKTTNKPTQSLSQKFLLKAVSYPTPMWAPFWAFKGQTYPVAEDQKVSAWQIRQLLKSDKISGFGSITVYDSV